MSYSVGRFETSLYERALLFEGIQWRFLGFSGFVSLALSEKRDSETIKRK
jgi:hypothetical protein